MSLPPLNPLLKASGKRTREIFASCPDDNIKDDERRFVTLRSQHADDQPCNSARIRLSVKINDEYKDYKQLPPALLSQQGPMGPSRPKDAQRKLLTAGRASQFTSHFVRGAHTKFLFSDLRDFHDDCND